MALKEIRRAFSSTEFKIALCIGIVLAIIQYFLTVYPSAQLLAFSAQEEMIPHSVFSKWMGSDFVTFVPSLYFMALPILCTLPHGESYYSDKSSGYIRQMLMRKNRSVYLRAKYISVFLSAGAVVVIPLLLNLFLSAITLPSIYPVLTAGYFPTGHATRFLPQLLYENPYLYTAIYLVIIFAFSGGIAGIALAVAPFANNRFIVYIAPFVIVTFVGTICTFLGHSEFNTSNFLQPLQPVFCISWASMGISFFAAAILPAALFFGWGLKHDVF